MPLLYLVRHGRAAASFDAHHDPGLDEVGRAQAVAAAETLAKLPRLSILSSPMQRCRETAAPLERLWGRIAAIEPRVSEIPSPTDDLAARTAWLRRVMAGHWSEAEAAIRAWRSDVATALLALEEDTVVFSHFVAINAAVGTALGDDRVTVFRPDNASITRIETVGGRLKLLERGREAETSVG